ncbi:ANTAR domain-containing response regulator [Gemmatirosa kalamazoonensis]|nr:ANTAR domain-containing protein [Gemmatirosa kalamazoonensis]
MADDDGEGRALLVTMLSSLGHEIVAEVGTGRDAVVLAQAASPDVVLLDVHMPDGSGIDAAKEIAAMLPATAVLLFTGDHTLRLSDQDVVETAAISILAKPTPKKTLDSALRLAVAKAQALNAARRDADRARQELEERKVIERAKGVLQRRTKCTEAEAYRIMQRSSQDRSVPMVHVAREVLKSEPGFGA